MKYVAVKLLLETNSIIENFFIKPSIRDKYYALNEYLKNSEKPIETMIDLFKMRKYSN